MKKIRMLEKFAAQSLVEHEGELIFSKEKFAELIVRECADVAANKDDNNIDIRFGRAVASGKILQHFGAE